MAHHKVIFTGTCGAGKSTAICAAVDPPAPECADGAAARPSSATACSDYGVREFRGAGNVFLYALAVNRRHNFMFTLLSQDATGFVVLLDGSRTDTFVQLEYHLQAFRRPLNGGGDTVVIGVTRTDLAPGSHAGSVICDVNRYLELQGQQVPVFQVDARKPADVTELLQAVLAISAPPPVRAPRL